MRSYKESGVLEEIRKAGGEVFAVTSEPQSLATEAEKGWGFGFTSTGDPHHEILDDCRTRGWLNLFTTKDVGVLSQRSWVAHPKGYFQPGVLVLTQEGRVLYRWRCRPTRKNNGGALSRPKPNYVWSQIKARLDTAEQGDAPLDENPELDDTGIWWPFFVLVLLAHGWFIRPKTFPLGREGEAKSVRGPKILLRVAGFFVGVAAAFAFLPTLWVLAALVAWGIFVWPGVAQIHREFQNVPEGEPSGL